MWKFKPLFYAWEKAGDTHENLYQLFEGREYAKLGIYEKDLSHSWDFWNRPSPGL